ncbi:MAG: GyrI-like domain-containing protein [Oscillospiraceae bacterium]|nr:GyrI-like domain-containing protein [Oscillospiraceae bacterium]
MKYRIEERTEMRFVGQRFFVSLEGGLDYTEIPAIWNGFPQESIAELECLVDSEPTGVVGLFADKHDNGFDFWIAAATTKTCPAHCEVITIPASMWAIFEAKGPCPAAIQDTFARVYSEWFPTVDYLRIQIPEIEWFSQGDPTSEDYICEAWVPIVKK